MTDMGEKTAKDSHYARLRRQHRDGKTHKVGLEAKGQDMDRLYGLHTVAAALANPRRKLSRLMVTKNAHARLKLETLARPVDVEFCQPRQLDQWLGIDAVHQGVMLECAPLKPRSLSSLQDCQLVVVLDQVSDPHNVGALMRSSVAFNAGAMITTARHSAQTSGVLAKSASGALEMLDYIVIGNLAQALQQLHSLGFATIGLDSTAPLPLEQMLMGEEKGREKKIALVLGNEGRGLRLKTRDTVTHLARLDMPGAIKSLNVSNAGALALYVVSRFLQSS